MKFNYHLEEEHLKILEQKGVGMVRDENWTEPNWIVC